MKIISSLICGLLFTLSSQAQTIFLDEDFESGNPPTGWTLTQESGSVGWLFGLALESSGFPVPPHTQYAASNDDAGGQTNDASQDRLITPAIDLTPGAGSGVVLTFEYYQIGTYGSSGEIEVSTDGGASWTNVATVPNQGGSEWGQASVNLSAYTAFSNVLVAFRHNDNNGWGDGFAVDDIMIATTPEYDMAVTEIVAADYVLAEAFPVTATVTSLGNNNVVEVTLCYSIDGGAEVCESFNGISMDLDDSETLVFADSVNLSPEVHEICIRAASINGTPFVDENSANDELCKTVSALNTIPSKKTLLETYVGTWAQFSPDAYVIRQNILDNYPEVISIAHYNSDALTINPTTVQAPLFNTYIGGYPSGTIDRFFFENAVEVEQNRGNWETKVIERQAMVSPVAISITGQGFDAATREITVEMRADFFTTVTGDLRFNAFIIEDDVVGFGTGYDQVNFYNTQSGHPYFGAGNPIVNFSHQRVTRAILGEAWGTDGLIPDTVNAGDSYSHTYTYTLPADYDENNTSLVVVVQKYHDTDVNDRAILNAEEVSLSLDTFVSHVPEIEAVALMKTYPNPFSDYTQLEFALENNAEVLIEIYDISGRRVKTIAQGTMNTGQHSATWRGDYENGVKAADGLYFIYLNVDGKITQMPVVLNR